MLTQPLYREVLTKLPIVKSQIWELALPLWVMLNRVQIDRLVRPTMNREIGLLISVQIEAPNGDARRHGLLINGRGNQVPIVLHLTRETYIDGYYTHSERLSLGNTLFFLP